MAAARATMKVCCLLLCAGAAAEVDDAEVMVQTAVESQSLLENHIATFKLMSEAMGMKALDMLRSHPKKHHDSEDPATAVLAAGKRAPKKAGGLEKILGLRKPKEKEHSSPLDKLLKEPEAGCEAGDAATVSAHIKELLDEFAPKFMEANEMKDKQATEDYIEDLVPAECDMKKIISPAGIKWDPLKACMVAFSHVSEKCAMCPIRLLQKVGGKTLLDAPFSCAGKCGPVALAASKCGPEASECNEEVVGKLVPCLQCVHPKLIDYTECADLPNKAELPGRLQAIMSAIHEGEGKVMELVEKQFESGREELDLVRKNGTLLSRVLMLTVTNAMD